MAANKLTLRIVKSPYSDITKGSVLSLEELDNNFLNLKGGGVSTGSTIGTDLILEKLNGDKINIDLSSIVGSLYTGGNGITITTGNTIDLGGILTQDTVISGNSKTLDLGVSDSQLSFFNINSIQGREIYSIPTQGLTINKNPGGINAIMDATSVTGNVSYFDFHADNAQLKSNGNSGNTFSDVYVTPDFVTLRQSVSGSTTDSGLILSRSAGYFFEDSRATTKGLEYYADYSAGYTSLSLITKGDLDNAISAVTASDIYTTGYTYDNSNNFTISLSNGTNLTANISTVSGFTVNGDIVVENNALIKGDLTILGSATTINSETVLVKDNIITLNSNVTGTTTPILDAGIEVLRGSGATKSLIWDETNDRWQTDDDLGVNGNLYLDVIPTVDNALTQILVRDGADGEIKYRDVNSIISATTVTDGNATTANGTAVDLGGILNKNTTISGATYNLNLGTSDSRITDLDINAITSTQNFTAPGFGSIENVYTPNGLTTTNIDSTGNFTNIFTINPSQTRTQASDTSGSKTTFLDVSNIQLQGSSTDTATGQFSTFTVAPNQASLYHTDGGLTNNQVYLSNNNIIISHTDGTTTNGITIDATKLLLNGPTTNLNFTSTDTTFNDTRTITRGIEYTADYSSGYTSLSLITKGDLDNAITGVTASDTYTTGSTLIGNTIYFDRTDVLSAYTADLSSIIPSFSGVTNGLTTYGSDIGLGGIFTQNTVISGNSQTFDLGVSGSQLSFLRVNAIQSSEEYSVPGQVYTIQQNPGGASHIVDALSLNGTKAQMEMHPGYHQLTSTYDSGATTSQILLGKANAQMTVTLSGGTQSGLILDETTDDFIFLDSRATTKGLEYAADYSSGYTSLSLITKGDLDNAITGVTASDTYTTGSTLIGNTIYFDRTDTLSAYTTDLSSLVSSLTLTDGNGTTANGTAVDLGGTLTSDAIINGAGTRSIFLGQNNATDYLNILTINATQNIEVYNSAFGGTFAGTSVTKNPAVHNITNNISGASVQHIVDGAKVQALVLSGTITSESRVTTQEALIKYNDNGVGSELNLSLLANIFTDNTSAQQGIVYAGDYSATFVGNSLVSKTYVDNQISSVIASDTYTTGTTIVGNTIYFDRTDSLSAYSADISGILSANTLELNDLTDVTTGLPGTPTEADDGKILFYDHDTGQWITDDAVTHGTSVINCKKSTAGTIAKGLPVYLVGFDADLHTVELADATSGATMPVIGFTAEDLDNTNSKHVTTFGKLTGIDTTSTVSTLNPNGETWAVNDSLYISTIAGGLTKVRPTGGTTQIQRIAKVLKVDATGGQLFVFNTARTAGLPNLSTNNLWVGDTNSVPQEITIGSGLAITGTTLITSGVTDTNAIHSDVANEITAITEKTSVDNQDELIIEDSDAGFVKKSIKRINLVRPIDNTQASTASLTPNSDENDQETITDLATNLTINAPSGSPTNGQKLIIRIEDNGVARTLTWNAVYEVVGVTLPTTTTANKKMYIGCIYNATDATWDVVAVNEEA